MADDRYIRAFSANLLPEGGEVFYYPDLLSDEIASQYFQQLLSGVTWKQEPVRIFGKEIMQPRLTAWYGEKAYSYSGIDLVPKPWIAPLTDIKKRVGDVTGVTFSSALLNLYRDGQDAMGWHRDNEKSMGPVPVIASVSLGIPRAFQLRRYADKSGRISLDLQSGSLLLMKGATQKNWEHRVPRSSKIAGARINITFRTVE